MKPYLFLYLLYLLIPSIVFADAYRWIDANGNITYGSQPPENAHSVEKVGGKFSRYSSDKLLRPFRGRLQTKEPTPQSATKNAPESVGTHKVEQGELVIEHNQEGQITRCEIELKNSGDGPASNVFVAFEFEDGTLVPAVGPQTVEPDKAILYAFPSELLPMAIKTPAKKNDQATSVMELPKPKVVIHVAGKQL